MNINKEISNIMYNKSRNDNSVLFLIKVLLRNNRFDYYKLYIELAKSQGYYICSFKEFYLDKDNIDNKHLILRHDVDHITKATRQMYEIEKSCGVKSSYYFRFSTIDLELITDMISNGFEVGLHYETVADYVKIHNCSSIQQIDFHFVKKMLKHDIEYFNKITGIKTFSCASHGDAINIKLKYKNCMLFENDSASNFNIEFEVYDRYLYENYIDVHIMDCGLRQNFGFAYKSNPIDSILNNDKNIVLLAHPNHWNYSLFKRVKVMIALIIGKVEFTTKRIFERI